MSMYNKESDHEVEESAHEEMKDHIDRMKEHAETHSYPEHWHKMLDGMAEECESDYEKKSDSEPKEARELSDEEIIRDHVKSLKGGKEEEIVKE